MRRPRGTTLAELLIVLAIMGTLLAMVGLPAAAALDRAAVRAAADDVAALFTRARGEALARRQLVWVVFDSASRRAVVRVGGGAAHIRALGDLYGVWLQATRDSMGYDARGLGYGAANLTLVLRRGRSLDSISVSRLGRVRRR